MGRRLSGLWMVIHPLPGDEDFDSANSSPWQSPPELLQLLQLLTSDFIRA